MPEYKAVRELAVAIDTKPGTGTGEHASGMRSPEGDDRRPRSVPNILDHTDITEPQVIWQDALVKVAP